MSERKITAPGPGWRMPGTVKGKNFNDSTPHLLNAMGNSIERSNKMDFGTPGVHTQNGFHQSREPNSSSPIWVLLTTELQAGSYSTPSNATATLLLPDSSIEENSLKDSPEVVIVWNYSESLTASVGDWVMAIPFNGVYVVIPSGGSSGSTTEIVRFTPLSACPGLTGDTSPDSCNCVEAVITRVVCGSLLEVGDVITVWDIDNCWFNIPIDQLLERSGTAILMNNNVTDGSAPNCTGYGELRPEDCFWNVESMCCGEEAYSDA